MEIKVLDKTTDKAEIEMDDLTFVNILHETLWKKKIDYSAYNKDHPYLSKPVLVVKSKDAKKSLIDASEAIADNAAELKKKFLKAVKG